VLPVLNLYETWKVILPLAFFLAMIGIAETLMTLEAIDAQIRGNTDGKGNEIMERGLLYPIRKVLLNNPRDPASAQQEVLAQGVGNVLSGLFGTMGGCAMIGQSMINVQTGGDRRLSSVLAGVLTLLVIISLSPVIGIIPLGSLVGVMVCVSYHTFEFSSLGWMLNSVFGGGRTFFGFLRRDGCLSKFFYGEEEESTTDPKKNLGPESVHIEVSTDGEPSLCEVTTDEEAVARASEVITDEEAEVEDSENRPLTSGGSRLESSKLDKIHSSSSSIVRSPRPQVSKVHNETDITSKEEKLSDLNIMDTLVIVLTVVLTIKTNLAVAVLAGAFASNLERYIRRNKFFTNCVRPKTEMSSTGMTKMKENKITKK